MIYVIDHNDSFTHNVVHQFALFDKVECDNYDKVSENKIKQASTIIFSPGPGNPKNYPITSKIYKKYKGKKKIIGICLGFQHILFWLSSRPIGIFVLLHLIVILMEFDLNGSINFNE